MLLDGVQGLSGQRFPVCVIGSGPVGLALSTDLARQKVNVLLLESGGKAPDSAIQQLSHAHLQEPRRHDDMSVAVARRLGGSSNLWGGRCIPYDPIDFEDRDFIDARWPIGNAALEPYWKRAVAATLSGAAIYAADTPLTGPDSDFTGDALERWVNVQASQDVFSDVIRDDPHLHVRTHATLVGVNVGTDGRVEAIEIAHSLSGERVRVPVERLVIAAGGIETARQLLMMQRDRSELFGGPEGVLGRYYMGHVLGEIADVVFDSPATAASMDFYVDDHGSYVRRRFVPTAGLQRREQLLNSAFWPVVPAVSDPRHQSAILSSVYLALAFKPLGRRLVAEAIRLRHVPEEAHDLSSHVRNVALGLPSAIGFTAQFFRKRFGGAQRLPGFFVKNKANRYGLSYHGEQVPNRDSRVWLTCDTDRLGSPSLGIDLRFCQQDADSLVRTHDLLGDWLVRHRLGRIEYRCDLDTRVESILDQATHGTHQVGLARMGLDRHSGVVDESLATFDIPNLFLASSAVLPTSSQANPTLTAIALALRLADHLSADIAAPVPAVAMS